MSVCLRTASRARSTEPRPAPPENHAPAKTIPPTAAYFCHVGHSPAGPSGLEYFFFFQAEDGIRDFHVTGVQTCALPILRSPDGKEVALSPSLPGRAPAPPQ